jgi:uncharacterized Zn-binding protein involved in type VI secretion
MVSLNQYLYQTIIHFNMKPIARLGDLHSCPKKGHGTSAIVSVAADSDAGGRPIATVGDRTGCGAIIIEGSSKMSIDGRPVAYVGCKTSHGGTIITGDETLLVEP